jgi:hypothetical protein
VKQREEEERGQTHGEVKGFSIWRLQEEERFHE